MGLVNNSIEHLDQIETIITQLSAEQYNKQLTSLSNSSIGQHTRHIIECYQALINHEECIIYDARKRDLSIETEPSKATALLQEIKIKLPYLDLNQAIQIKASYDYYEEEGKDEINSTHGRELMHNLDHMIHHFALIKIGLNQLVPEVNRHPNFGIAPSTIRHRNK